jgi:hypothetical protein
MLLRPPFATMAKKIVGNSAIGVAFSEGARMWPFVFGFATTLGLVTLLSQNLDRKFQPHAWILLSDESLL